MTPSRTDIELSAEQRWGKPNRQLSSRDELRFGKHGSVSVRLDTNEWYDHEIETGGHVVNDRKVELVERPRICVAKYNYLNLDGSIHIQVLRYMPRDFRQRRPDPNAPDHWIWSVKGIPAIPYCQTEMLQSDYVIIVEGEKDVDALRGAGYVATCNAMGARKWPPELTPYFEGKDVFIIPDNDDAGQAHAAMVGDHLFEATRSVRIADVCKSMHRGADISDWLEERPPDELMQLLQEANPIVARVAPSDLDVNTLDVFQTLDADDITAVTTTDDFVEGLLSKGQMSVVYGASNCGKTFFMSDLCMHIARGKTWRDKEVDAGGVLYVAAEGAYGIRNRIAAYKQYSSLEHGIPFSVIPTSVNMMDKDTDLQKLINTIQLKAQEMGSVAIVVFDTLARVMAGGNENAAEDMGQLVINADRIRQVTEAHVCFIHHSGKDESRGSRGSSALKAATDTEIEIRKTGSVSTATVTKQRELEVNGSYAFRLEVVEIGQNARGKSVTSCVVKEAEAASSDRKKQQPRGANQKIILKALRNLGADGKLFPAKLAGLPAKCRGLSLSDFHDLAADKLTCDSKHRKSRFNDAVNSLVADEFLGLEEGFLWLIP